MAEENTEVLSSNNPREVENDIVCLRGETGLEVLVGETDADRLGGEPVGVILGVLFWDAKRSAYDTRGLEAAILTVDTIDSFN